jgi:hypothetical protein
LFAISFVCAIFLATDDAHSGLVIRWDWVFIMAHLLFYYIADRPYSLREYMGWGVMDGLSCFPFHPCLWIGKALFIDLVAFCLLRIENDARWREGGGGLHLKSPTAFLFCCRRLIFFSLFLYKDD